MYQDQSVRIANKEVDDDLFEELEQSYTDLHFGKNNREMDNMAQNLYEQVKGQEMENEDGEGSSGSDSDEEEKSGGAKNKQQ